MIQEKKEAFAQRKILNKPSAIDVTDNESE